MSNFTSDSSLKPNGALPDFKSKINGAEQQLEKMAQNAGERVGAAASEIANTTADTMKVSREYVQSNPVKGVAIAAAVGLVTGSLLSMAFRNRKD